MIRRILFIIQRRLLKNLDFALLIINHRDKSVDIHTNINQDNLNELICHLNNQRVLNNLLLTLEEENIGCSPKFKEWVRTNTSDLKLKDSQKN